MAGPVTGTSSREDRMKSEMDVKVEGMVDRSPRWVQGDEWARRTGVRVRFEQEGVKGPKSEVSAPSAQRARCEMKLRPQGVRRVRGKVKVILSLRISSTQE